VRGARLVQIIDESGVEVVACSTKWTWIANMPSIVLFYSIIAPTSLMEC
jgi:hypothetical protein